MKKSIIILMIMVALLSLSSVSFGEGTSVDSEVIVAVQADVDQTNALIDSLIDDAVCDSKEIVNDYEKAVRRASKELKGLELEERLECLYMNKEVVINNLIDNLVNETNAIAQAMFDRAAALGVTVICELVPVEIDDRIVMIDPIRVVGD